MSTLDFPVGEFEKWERRRNGKEKEEERKSPTTSCHSNAKGTNSLHHASLAFGLGIDNGTLQRARQVGMEQWPAEVVDGRHPGRGSLVRFAVLQLLAQIAAARGAGDVMAVRNHVELVAPDAVLSSFFRALASELQLVFVSLRGGRGAVLAADFRHAEDGLPALIDRRVALRSGESEAGRGQGSFRPAVVDAGDMPVYRVRGSVAVQLVADVDEVLDRCDVHVVDGGEVKDDGFERGSVGFDGENFTAAWARVIPGTILNCMSVITIQKWSRAREAYAEFGVLRGIGAPGLFENGGDHVVEVMVGIGVIEAFREAVDEDARVG